MPDFTDAFVRSRLMMQQGADRERDRNIQAAEARRRVTRGQALADAAQGGDLNAQVEMAALGLMRPPESPEEIAARQAAEQRFQQDMGLRERQFQTGQEQFAQTREDVGQRHADTMGLSERQFGLAQEKAGEQKRQFGLSFGLEQEKAGTAKQMAEKNQDRAERRETREEKEHRLRITTAKRASGEQLSLSGKPEDEKLQSYRLDVVRGHANMDLDVPEIRKTMRRAINDLRANGYQGVIPGEDQLLKREGVEIDRKKQKSAAQIAEDSAARTQGRLDATERAKINRLKDMARGTGANAERARNLLTQRGETWEEESKPSKPSKSSQMPYY